MIIIGDYGFRSGYGFFQNLQSGTIDFTSAQSTASVSFAQSMRNLPAVVFGNSANTGVWYSTRSQNGFTAERASTGAAETVSWVAFDDSEQN